MTIEVLHPIRTAAEYAVLCLAGGSCGDPNDNGNIGPATSEQHPRACWNCEQGREAMRAIYGELPAVTYRPGWEFRWSCANGLLFLHCIVGEPDAKGWDAVTGERRGSGDWMWVTELPLNPKWLLGKIAQMENHERREWFKVDGHPPCWPHRTGGGRAGR